MKVHPTAVVDPSAALADDVEVGPFCIVGPGVTLGPGCRLLARVSIIGPVRAGRDNVFHPNSAIGGPPQDLKPPAADGRVEIGDGNIFREAVTVHRPKMPGGVTRIGSRNRLHFYAHVGHDSTLGNGVVLSCSTLLAGHTTVQDEAWIGSLCCVHQFVTVGRRSLTRGLVAVSEDVPPFMWIDGNHFEVQGVNPRYRNEALERAYTTIWRSGLPLKEALGILGKDPTPEVAEIAAFMSRRSAGRFGRAGEGGREPAA